MFTLIFNIYVHALFLIQLLLNAYIAVSMLVFFFKFYNDRNSNPLK